MQVKYECDEKQRMENRLIAKENESAERQREEESAIEKGAMRERKFNYNNSFKSNQIKDQDLLSQVLKGITMYHEET